MTPADELRQAATKARKVAGRATAGPWFADIGAFAFVMAPDLPDGESVAMVCDADAGNTEHLSLWHPAVALAVADWLDSEAEATEWMRNEDPTYTVRNNDEGLTVARLLLATPTGREQ